MGHNLTYMNLFLPLFTFVHCNQHMPNILLLPHFPLSSIYSGQVFFPKEDHESNNSHKSVNEGSYLTKNVQEESKLGDLTNSEPPCQAPRDNEINSRPSESCTYAQTKST